LQSERITDSIASIAETQTIYARVQPHVKEAADDYAAASGMTLANAVSELLERGLETTSNERSVGELEQQVAVLRMELEAQRNREETLASVYHALSQRTAQTIGTCPSCSGSVTGHDLLVAGHCPNRECGSSLSALLGTGGTALSKGGLNDGDFKLLLGALGLLLAVAFVSQQNGGG
jgi:uncharacterized small protein (DUF1192 family)